MSFGLPDPMARFEALSPQRDYRRPYSPEEMKPATEGLLDYGTTGLRKLGPGYQLQETILEAH